jgi:hypothetical protein
LDQFLLQNWFEQVKTHNWFEPVQRLTVLAIGGFSECFRLKMAFGLCREAQPYRNWQAQERSKVILSMDQYHNIILMLYHQ